MQRRLKTSELTRVSMFVALIAIGAFIKIPIPNMPFTLQFLFTNLASILLGANLGTCSVIIYIILGLIGIPVFTSGGGPAYIFMPTFGYLLGFVVGTFLGGKYLEIKGYSLKNIFISSLLNLMVVYAIGMAYYYFITNFYLKTPFSIKSLIIYCFLLAVPGDIFLCVVSSFVGNKITKLTGVRR